MKTQMSNNSFEIGDCLICIKDIHPLKFGCSYRINGSGDLTWNNATDKEGFGYAVGLEGDYQNLYYFTEKEMFQYFALEHEMIKIKLRDVKITQLLDLDKYK